MERARRSDGSRRRSTGPSTSSLSINRTVPACDMPTPSESRRMDWPELSFSRDMTVVAGPGNGEASPEVTVISTATALTNDPK